MAHRSETMPMINGILSVPMPRSEPVLAYAPGSPERRAIRVQLEKMAREVTEIPARIGGRKIATGDTVEAVAPHDHHHVPAVWHRAHAREVRASGTNDKAGSPLNLLRWVSPRAVKETFVPPAHFAYPFMQPRD